MSGALGITNPFATNYPDLMKIDESIAKQQYNRLLGEDLRSQIAERQAAIAYRQAPGDYGPRVDATPAQGAPAATGTFERQLGGAEGGTNPAAVNAGGYSGQFQFGAARLADLGLYKPAEGEDLKKNEWKGTFSIPGFAATTHEQFLASPAAQHAAFAQHVADIDKVIASTPGAAQLDQNGLRAVAHLGGNAGMQRFIQTGGLYDPADSNGTRLSDYYKKFAAGGAPALQAAFGSPHGPGGPPQQPNVGPQMPGGVAARTGGTDVAGPGGAPRAPIVTDATLGAVSPDEAWLNEQAKTYPDLAGPNANPTAAPINAPGGAPAAVPAQTAAAAVAPPPPAPAATAAPTPQAPAVPPPTPPPRTNEQGLTNNDQDRLGEYRRSPTSTVAGEAAMRSQMVQRNETLKAQYRNELQQDAATRLAAQTRAETLAAQGLPPGWHIGPSGKPEQIPEVKAAEAEQGPFHGAGMEPQEQNILDKGDDGSARYARVFTKAAQPKYNVADGSWTKPNMAAYDKPTYVPKGMTEPPDYSQQETPTPKFMNAEQSKNASFADRVQQSLPVITDTSPAAMSRWDQLLGKTPIMGNTLVSPEFQLHQQSERNFINAVLRRESGAAISEGEFVNARQQYIPQPGDKPPVLAEKARNRETLLAGMIRDAGPAYKPAAASAPTTPAASGGWSVKRLP